MASRKTPKGLDELSGPMDYLAAIFTMLAGLVLYFVPVLIVLIVLLLLYLVLA